MNLQLIKDEVCPECRSEVVAESCLNRHCNGQGFEVRRFACGCELAWSPNFERMEVNSRCPKRPDAVARRAKRSAAFEAIQKAVAALDVDDEWKQDALFHLGYARKE